MKGSAQSIRAGVSPASCRRAGGRGPSPCTPYPLLRSRAEGRVASSDRQKPSPHATPNVNSSEPDLAGPNEPMPTHGLRLHRPFPCGRGPRRQGQSEVPLGLRYARGASS
jgi:hypothetical protein